MHTKLHMWFLKKFRRLPCKENFEQDLKILEHVFKFSLKIRYSYIILYYDCVKIFLIINFSMNIILPYTFE